MRAEKLANQEVEPSKERKNRIRERQITYTNDLSSGSCGERESRVHGP
jgi:hypothetical protein